MRGKRGRFGEPDYDESAAVLTCLTVWFGNSDPEEGHEGDTPPHGVFTDAPDHGARILTVPDSCGRRSGFTSVPKWLFGSSAAQILGGLIPELQPAAAAACYRAVDHWVTGRLGGEPRRSAGTLFDSVVAHQSSCGGTRFSRTSRSCSDGEIIMMIVGGDDDCGSSTF